MILSSSVGDGGRVSIEIVVIISAVIPAVVVVGVGVVGLRGAALPLVVPVFSSTRVLGPSVFLGGLFNFSGVTGVFLSSWSHMGLIGDAIMDGDGRFGS